MNWIDELIKEEFKNNNPCDRCQISRNLCHVCGYNKARKAALYEPKKWALYENDRLIDVFNSHTAAKAALHFKKKEAYDDWLDLDYKIKNV